MILVRAVLIWMALTIVTAAPIALSASSPLLAWRDPIYILAGFAGIFAMTLLLVQPLLVAGYLPGLSGFRGRRAHRWVGVATVVSVIVHVLALWITSPPDVIDAFLFRSPTPFSAWGVIAMWAVFAAALLGVLRRRLRLRPRHWRRYHTALAAVVVAGSVVHAMLIEGTMETISKVALCVLVLAATVKALADLRIWTYRTTSR
ncbi:ferric reductase-like transmembrane domain-containing protein [Aliiroseovarius sp. S1339]|uniref:ferric reductase-like transmembrane domain-containing protein n=1 Tax=Aliiroseovarius sp. S1339 TaxID=2936990 RepID=UPI0020BE894B|nr:ferric reductase-like transmembrane domain-containing protein [Aliiroseovarius sp. S1339]MCK8464589.1 ferric reductase-like transmembrane domain-containing protein [Aliiroseovarius sp. S1339]